MEKEDEEKTAFITSQAIFCYTKMPFGLRNAGATYQRPMDKEFQKQISRNLKVYVDDLVIKSRIEDEIVRDIEETFKSLREINMKLNPKKCTFGIQSQHQGAKSMSRQAEEAFKQMKQLISELPMLAAPMKKEELIVYLAAAKETILADFIVERPEEDSPDTLIEVEEELPEPKRDGIHLCPKIQANVNSRLVANQVNGIYVTKEDDMIRYLEKVRTLTSSFKAFSIRQVPRSENKKADALSKVASTSFAHLSKQVLVEELKEKSISKVEILAVVEEEGDTWMTLIFEYLTEETLSVDAKKERAVRHKS
ncbi:reverse transcriptase domain-containing protein [Tanacetum coccineum]